MKDITQPGMLDNSVYGWPKTQMPDGVNFYAMGGFAFSEEPLISVLTYPPMFFGFDNKLQSTTYRSSGWNIIVNSPYVGNPVHLDVQFEGGNDVIYFCTRDGYYSYIWKTATPKKFLTFDKETWNIKSDDEIDVCYYLRATNRIILVVRDKVGVWGLTAGVWAQLFTPKKRFWYNYKLQALELGLTGHIILYAKHAFMVLDSANLDEVHVWNREWDWGDWGTWNYVIQMGYGIAKFDAQNPYPQTFKEVKGVYRINSWDGNSNSPIITVKDTGELGTYVYATGTFTSLSTTSHFWDACFTDSDQKVVAVSWLQNAQHEFDIHPNLWTANDHTKDWYLWYLDWSSG
jgi:hypothetical protein